MMEGSESDKKIVHVAALLDPPDLEGLAAHYVKFLGEPHIVFAQVVPLPPVAVSVYAFAATPERPYITLATAGMSALPLAMPTEWGPDWDRAEVLTYLPADWDFESPIGKIPEGLLKLCGAFPHLSGAWVGEGHTFAAEGGAPLFPNTLLTHFFLRAPVYEDPEFFHFRAPSGFGAHIYWFVPVTADECYLARRDGSAELASRLDNSDVLEIDVDRASVVLPENRAQRRARRRSQKARRRRPIRKPLEDISCAIHDHGHDVDPHGDLTD
jgi:hypothetical protein